MGLWKKHETTNPSLAALERGDIDFSGSPSIMSHGRLDQGTVINLYWTYRNCFLFLETSNREIRIYELISPFSSGSWYLTISSIVFCSVVLSLLIRLQYHNKRKDLGLSVILTVGAVCQQTYEYFPRRASLRTAMVFVALHGLLLCNYYSASLVSARLVDQQSSINDSLNELAKTNLDLASEPLPYLNFLLKVGCFF